MVLPRGNFIPVQIATGTPVKLTTGPIHIISVDICMTTVKRVHRFVPKIAIIRRASVRKLTSVASKRDGRMLAKISHVKTITHQNGGSNTEVFFSNKISVLTMFGCGCSIVPNQFFNRRFCHVDIRNSVHH